MKTSELKQIIREEISKVLNTLHENFISFSDLEDAIKKHKEGNDDYNETKLRNMFNQLKNNDQVKARKKYNEYFPNR
jgi:hypothetical protein